MQVAEIAIPPPTLAVKKPRQLGLKLIVYSIAAIVLLPIFTIGIIAFSGTAEDWPHLIANVLPRSTAITAWLMLLVAAGTGVIGVTSAWLINSFEFPLRRVMAWALVLPLAIPTYLAAYAFTEFFHYTGPVQGLIREMFGYTNPRQYWFPDIRSTGGAAIVLSAVLYPYVYLTTRVVFLMQGRNLADAARTLGAGRPRVLLRVVLPVARPAIVAGIALALMETLNDIGAAEYLGVRTLTISVYTTWLNRGSMEGAAQIAIAMLAIVFLLLALEQMARRKQRYHQTRVTQLGEPPSRTQLTGFPGLCALLATLLPVLFGFGIPVHVLAGYAWVRSEQLSDPALMSAFLNSLVTASAAAILAVFVALLMLNAGRLCRSPAITLVGRLGALGYALPGTILGFGLLYALTSFDRLIDGVMRQVAGISTGLMLSGTAAAVILACTIRFLALADGAIRSGLEKLPPHLDEAARNLGRTPMRSATEILLPLLRPAILTAAILVFVDTVKELSATIVLRPFGFTTLATHVYENASRGAVEQGAMAALLIIATSLIPVILLSRALIRDKAA